MNASSMIRPESPADNDSILALQMKAFGPGAAARAAFRVREQAPHDRSLSFVLADGSSVVGSVRQTHVVVGTEAGLLLGPLVVDPISTNSGFGRALVRKALDAARRKGERYVILVGDAPFYRPLGFEHCVGSRVALPGPVDPVRLLVAEFVPGVADKLKGMVFGVPPA